MNRITMNSIYDRAANIPGLFEAGEATGTARQLKLWQEALEAARKSAKKGGEDEKGIWDILFENRAENHEEAMLLSMEAQLARSAMRKQLNAEAAERAYAAAEANMGGLE